MKARIPKAKNKKWRVCVDVEDDRCDFVTKKSYVVSAPNEKDAEIKAGVRLLCDCWDAARAILAEGGGIGFETKLLSVARPRKSLDRDETGA